MQKIDKQKIENKLKEEIGKIDHPRQKIKQK